MKLQLKTKAFITYGLDRPIAHLRDGDRGLWGVEKL